MVIVSVGRIVFKQLLNLHPPVSLLLSKLDIDAYHYFYCFAMLSSFYIYIALQFPTITSSSLFCHLVFHHSCCLCMDMCHLSAGRLFTTGWNKQERLLRMWAAGKRRIGSRTVKPDLQKYLLRKRWLDTTSSGFDNFVKSTMCCYWRVSMDWYGLIVYCRYGADECSNFVTADLLFFLWKT